MNRFAGLIIRLRRAFGRRAHDEQMAEEMRAHLELETARRIAAGEDPVEARRLAAIAFGPMEAIEERVRDARLGTWIEQTWRDVVFAARGLRKDPGFAAIAVLTLAIGIGANTAIFSVVSGLLLNPLPYPDSGRIVEVNELPAPGAFGASCGGSFMEWQQNQQHFDLLAARHDMNHNFTGEGDPVLVRGWEVTPQFLGVFGLRPALGRDFRAEDDAPGANARMVIISHRFWQNRLAGARDVVGRFVRFDGDAYEVIGVLEPDALMDPDIDFLAPTGILSDPAKQNRDYHYVTTTVARLTPGATVEAAAAHLTAVKQANKHLYPDRKKEWTVGVRTLQESMFGNARQSLNLLLGSVGVVLLIACVNVANLLLARTTSRRGELALRLALGASRGRIVRQMLTESLLLAFLGGVAGVALAAVAIEPLAVFTGVAEIQRLRIGLDGQVLGFALGATVLTGLLFGLLPAWRAARPDVNEHLKEGGRGGSHGGRRGLQSVLIVSETALTVVLLVVAGLLIRSFVNAAAEDVGFRREGVLTFRVAASGEHARTIDNRIRFSDRILAQLGQIPGVTASALITNMPMNGRVFYGDAIRRVDQPETDANITAGFDAVSPRFFEAMGIPLLRGRTFTEADNRTDAPKVMVVNQALVARFFPDGEDPIGRHILFKGAGYEIVGIAGDIRRYSMDLGSPMQVYIPLAHFPWGTHYLVRTVVPPLSVAAQVRRAVQEVQPDQPVFDVNTLEAMADETLRTRTMMLTLLSLFAAAALILACVGIYGVMAYAVTQRTREMGIRLALGAAAQDVLRMVIRDGLRIVVIGLVLGAAGAGFATALLQNQLYDTGRLDPVTYTAVAVVLLGVGTAACLVPARRASRVDPIISLRSE